MWILAEIKLNSYQGRKDGSSIEADERGGRWRFVVFLLTLPQMGGTMLNKLVVILHQIASVNGR